MPLSCDIRELGFQTGLQHGNGMSLFGQRILTLPGAWQPVPCCKRTIRNVQVEQVQFPRNHPSTWKKSLPEQNQFRLGFTNWQRNSSNPPWYNQNNSPWCWSRFLVKWWAKSRYTDVAPSSFWQGNILIGNVHSSKKKSNNFNWKFCLSLKKWGSIQTYQTERNVGNVVFRQGSSPFG